MKIYKKIMGMQYSDFYSKRWAPIFFLLFFCLALYFLNLGRWDLWNPDEPRYAQVAREIVSGGDWILLHFNEEVYTDKPPLFFWFISLSSYLWKGLHSFSVRFPSALFGTLTVLLTFFLGKSLFRVRTGFFSGLILATTLGFAYLSTRANIDTTLTFFITGAFYCFFKWYLNDSPLPQRLCQKSVHGSTSSPRTEYSILKFNKLAVRPELVEGRRVNYDTVSLGERDRTIDFPLPQGERERVRGDLWIYGFYVGIALATLAKGPVGFILPLLVSLTYLILQKNYKAIKEMRLLPGMLLFILIVLAWYLPAVWKGGREYLDATLLHHSLDRFAKGTSHIRPIYYYLYNFPIDFLPWIFFLPGAIVYGLSEENGESRKEFYFLLVWFVVIFLFFSISKGKRGLYLLPLFPSASLMVGKFWDDIISTKMEWLHHGWITLPQWVFMGLAFIGGAAVPWVVSTRFPSFLSYSLPISFLMIGGGLTFFVLYRFKYRAAIFFLLVGMMAGGFFYTWRVVFPLTNPYKSARYICQEVSSRIKPGEKLGLYGGFGTGPFNFYTGIVPILELQGEEDFLQFLRSPERVFCFLKFRDFSLFKKREESQGIHLIARCNVGSDDIVLISNQ